MRPAGYWSIIIIGYVVQMTSVPALALTNSWPAAAALIILERTGKAMRNPPRDVMLAHAAQHVGGYGWVFGLHEGLDQFGAMLGPIAIAIVLAHRGDYHRAFALLCVPSRAHSVPVEWIPVFYSVAMAVSGAGSLLLGRLFDRFGFAVLVGLTLIGALFAPLVFLGGFWTALAGAAVWGLGTGVHESIIPAAVAPMVPAHRRASAFRLFTAGYGVFWFLGSAVIGVLYEHSLMGAVIFCVIAQLAAIPAFVRVGRAVRSRSLT